MTSPSDLTSLSPQDRRNYGFARVRDAAFDAVCSLWARRQGEGMTQADLAAAIHADAGWVSKNLRGPGNWTLRTFGALVEALGGEVEIRVSAAEDPLPVRSNYHAYVEYPETTPTASAVVSPLSASGSQVSPRRATQPMLTTLIP